VSEHQDRSEPAIHWGRLLELLFVLFVIGGLSVLIRGHVLPLFSGEEKINSAWRRVGDDPLCINPYASTSCRLDPSVDPDDPLEILN
jgi:hypothetical protein